MEFTLVAVAAVAGHQWGASGWHCSGSDNPGSACGKAAIGGC